MPKQTTATHKISGCRGANEQTSVRSHSSHSSPSSMPVSRRLRRSGRIRSRRRPGGNRGRRCRAARHPPRTTLRGPQHRCAIAATKKRRARKSHTRARRHGYKSAFPAHAPSAAAVVRHILGGALAAGRRAVAAGAGSRGHHASRTSRGGNGWLRTFLPVKHTREASTLRRAQSTQRTAHKSKSKSKIGDVGGVAKALRSHTDASPPTFTPPDQRLRSADDDPFATAASAPATLPRAPPPQDNIHGDDQIDALHELNDIDKLAEYFAGSTEDTAVLGAYAAQLPRAIRTVDDFRKWLFLRPKLSAKGQQRFVYVQAFAQQLLAGSGRAPDGTALSVDLSKELPLELHAGESAPGVGLGIDIDPYAEADAHEAAHATVPEDTKSHGEITENPFVGRMNKALRQQNPETLQSYRAEAYKEADQRQLLMLLVGDVEASMFVDPATGELRNPKEIIKFTLTLLQPYRLGNSSVGVLFSHVNYAINFVVKYGYQVVSLCALVVMLMTCVYGLTYVASKAWHSRAIHTVVGGVLRVIGRGLAGMCTWLGSRALRLLGNRAMAKQIAAWTPKALFAAPWFAALVRVTVTGGAVGVLYHLADNPGVQMDFHEKERLTLMQYALRTVSDRYNQSHVMGLLARLTPDVTGIQSDLGDGITQAQMGVLRDVQERYNDIDRRIDHMRTDQYALLVSEFNNKYREYDGSDGISNRLLFLGNDMKSRIDQTLTSTQHTLAPFRKYFIETYPDEMRSFFFLNAYGHPRNATDVGKAFFLSWKDTDGGRLGLIPQVPYSDNGIRDYLRLTPMSILRRLRDKYDASPSDEIYAQKWWRVHAYLYKDDKTAIDLHDTFRTDSNTSLALLASAGVTGIGNIRMVQKQTGWQHRNSKTARENLTQRFLLYVDNVDRKYDLLRRMQYKSAMARVRQGQGKAHGFVQMEYDEQLHGMGAVTGALASGAGTQALASAARRSLTQAHPSPPLTGVLASGAGSGSGVLASGAGSGSGALMAQLLPTKGKHADAVADAAQQMKLAFEPFKASQQKDVKAVRNVLYKACCGFWNTVMVDGNSVKSRRQDIVDNTLLRVQEACGSEGTDSMTVLSSLIQTFRPKDVTAATSSPAELPPMGRGQALNYCLWKLADSLGNSVENFNYEKPENVYPAAHVCVHICSQGNATCAKNVAGKLCTSCLGCKFKIFLFDTLYSRCDLAIPYIPTPLTEEWLKKWMGDMTPEKGHPQNNVKFVMMTAALFQTPVQTTGTPFNLEYAWYWIQRMREFVDEVGCFSYLVNILVAFLETAGYMLHRENPDRLSRLMTDLKDNVIKGLDRKANAMKHRLTQYIDTREFEREPKARAQSTPPSQEALLQDDEE